MLSCIGFPECRAVQYFPGFVTDAVPHESVCSKVERGGGGVDKLGIHRNAKSLTAIDQTFILCVPSANLSAWLSTFKFYIKFALVHQLAIHCSTH